MKKADITEIRCTQSVCVPPAESYQLYVPELAPVGKAVGRIRASDEDEGPNAEMTYSITNAEAAAIFTIATDADRREGIISLQQVKPELPELPVPPGAVWRI